MAIMIPSVPKKYDPASQEGLMFAALATLPDDYYVFHSFQIVDSHNDTMHESETDFVIFNRFKGIISLEAKAGQVKYEGGYWYYGNGTPMHNGGPFVQASTNKYKLLRRIEETSFKYLLARCKLLHAVWFPSVSNDKLRTITLPSEGDRTLVLTKEALLDPKQFIERIFSLKLENGIETSISDLECRQMVREIFCPQFNVIPSASLEVDLKKIAFHRFLEEQTRILDFLEEQQTAAINGVAGTGKTMIAVEKARRLASSTEKVLFLCFNKYLKDHLEKNYARDNVSYYTIAGYACSVCNTSEPDYGKLKMKLEEYYLTESFPYNHVIIDEGQDFGYSEIEENGIVGLLKDLVTDIEKESGAFYVFYDRLQLIQAWEMPKFIEELDCKMTLYRNCRNTENIAITSLRPIPKSKPRMFQDSVKGAPARIYYCESNKVERERIDKTISKLASEGYKDIVILTCKTESTSVLSDFAKDGKYRNKYLFTTCRKFKGLEADVIILVDIDRDTFEGENVLLYYVGASRARIKLEMVANLNKNDCEHILSLLNYTGKIRKAQRELADAFNAIGEIEQN